MTSQAGFLVWMAAVVVPGLDHLLKWLLVGRLDGATGLKGKIDGIVNWLWHGHLARSVARPIVYSLLLLGTYLATVRNWPDAIGLADVGLLLGVFVYWAWWAASTGGERDSEKGKEAKGSIRLLRSSKARVLAVVGLGALYLLTMKPFIPSGTIRYVHSHLGFRPALQTGEIQCGPRLQVVLPFVDRVYDYPVGFQRLEFSEGGAVAPIRTETRNGHEIELDVIVVYKMFPEFELDAPRGKPAGESNSDDSSTETPCETEVRGGHFTDGGLSPPQRFQTAWQQRLIDPLVQRVVRDNVNRYYLNQVYSSESRAFIQGMLLAELNGGTPKKLDRKAPFRVDAPGNPAPEPVASTLFLGPGEWRPPLAVLHPQPFLISVESPGPGERAAPYVASDDAELVEARLYKKASSNSSIAGPLFRFEEVVILDVRIIDREFAQRIRRKHLQEEAREELLIENRRLHQELLNVQIRKDIELNKALIEADKIKVMAEADLQKARLEAAGIAARGEAEADARDRLVKAHGKQGNAYSQIEVARHLAAGIDRVIVTPEMNNMIPIIQDIGDVIENIASSGRTQTAENGADTLPAPAPATAPGGSAGSE